MFAGLDDIDWAAMNHAYGPAGKVPNLVRGLVDPDPAVREEALDAMYGAVHHQGDVYDCTVAAVPFLLEALTTRDLHGRSGVAELLASIGGADWWPLAEGDDTPMRARTRRARGMIGQALPALCDLVDDYDPLLRGAMPRLLTVCADQPLVVELLAARLDCETDREVRRALLDGLSRLAVLTGDPGITDRLLALAVDAPDASTAVAALVAVARIDPLRVPVDAAAELLEKAYAEPATPSEPAGFSTNTLIGSIRVIREQANAGHRAPHAARLVDSFTDSLGSRVAERSAILTTLLRSRHADVTADALYGASKLIERWRGDHTELVHLIASHLAHPFPRMADHAATSLSYWAPLTAPTADTIAERLAALAIQPWRDGLPAWTISWSDAPGLHPYLVALGELGDPRALPYLVEALHVSRRPRETGHLLARFPERADTTVAALLPVLPDRRPGERPPPEWYGIHAALRAYGAASAPAVPWLLAQPLDDDSVRTLGSIGPAAAPVTPALRRALTSGVPALTVAAAEALWRIEHAGDVLPVLTAQIDGPAGYAALRAIATMGAPAESAVPSVQALLSDHQRGAVAAITLWRLTRDAERTAPLLTAAWHDRPQMRNEIIDHADGPLLARLAPLLQAELTTPRRHGLSDTGWSSRQVTDDERLLNACRSALTTLGAATT